MQLQLAFLCMFAGLGDSPASDDGTVFMLHDIFEVINQTCHWSTHWRFDSPQGGREA